MLTYVDNKSSSSHNNDVGKLWRIKYLMYQVLYNTNLD